MLQVIWTVHIVDMDFEGLTIFISTLLDHGCVSLLTGVQEAAV